MRTIGQLLHKVNTSIFLELPNRTGKQIRERYINHLRSDIEKKLWTQ